MDAVIQDFWMQDLTEAENLGRQGYFAGKGLIPVDEALDKLCERWEDQAHTNSLVRAWVEGWKLAEIHALTQGMTK